MPGNVVRPVPASARAADRLHPRRRHRQLRPAGRPVRPPRRSRHRPHRSWSPGTYHRVDAAPGRPVSGARRRFRRASPTPRRSCSSSSSSAARSPSSTRPARCARRSDGWCGGSSDREALVIPIVSLAFARRRRAREHVGGDHRARAGAAAGDAAARVRRRHRGRDQRRRRRGRRRLQPDQSVPGADRAEARRAAAALRRGRSASSVHGAGARGLDLRGRGGTRCARGAPPEAGDAGRPRRSTPRRHHRPGARARHRSSCSSTASCGSGWDFDQMSALFFAMGLARRADRRTRRRRHGAGFVTGFAVDGLRGDADRLRPRDLRRARSGPDHRHGRQRAGHAAAAPAGRASARSA